MSAKKSKLLEKARQAKNEYQRQWRKKNPEKVKQYQESYWIRKVQEVELSEV